MDSGEAPARTKQSCREGAFYTRPLESELQLAGGDLAPSLLGGGKRGQKVRHGPRRPGRKQGTGMKARILRGDMLSSEAVRLAKITIVGPTMRIPPWKFGKAQFFNTTVVQAGAFLTKVNCGGVNGSQIVGHAGAQGNAFAFSIGDIPGISNYTQLFDQFIITKIVLRIKSVGVVATTGGSFNLMIVIDKDNSNLLTSQTQAEEYQNMQELRAGQSFQGDSYVAEIVPTLLDPSLAGNQTVGPRWQDVAITTNQHFGFKTWYNTTAVTDPIWNVEAQYTYGFANLQ
jgi:hypothetical protein